MTEEELNEYLTKNLKLEVCYINDRFDNKAISVKLLLKGKVIDEATTSDWMYKFH